VELVISLLQDQGFCPPNWTQDSTRHPSTFVILTTLPLPLGSQR